MIRKITFFMSFFLLSALPPAEARDPQRWLTPPAPQITEGNRIVPVAEQFDGERYILHFPKPQQGDWRQTRYVVEIRRNDDQKFSATLATRAFVKDDEVVFVTVPSGSAEKYNLDVIDKSIYPHQRVWSGTLSSILLMPKER